jgi:hypothetical protein
MVKARAEQIIDRPPDVVWGRISNFVDVTWIPNTGESRMDGDLRYVKMGGGTFEVAQRLVTQDDENHTYTYRLATELDLASRYGPGTVAKDLEATITVHPKGDSSSWITWDVDTHDFMVDGVRDEYQGALDNLKTVLEG